MASSSNDDNLDDPMITVRWQKYESDCPPAPDEPGIGIRIRKSILTTESAHFKTLLDGPFKEANSDVVDLYGDSPLAMGDVLHALAYGDPQYSLLTSPAAGDYHIAQEVYIIVDKYDLKSLRSFVVDKLLPGAWAARWRCPKYATLPGCAEGFERFHYDHLVQHFSDYPKELWPFYANALVHYRRAEPEADLFGHLLEDNPEMACGIARELIIQLAATKDEVAGLRQGLSDSAAVVVDLRDTLKATEEGLQELSKDLTANIKKQMDAAISGVKKSFGHNGNPEGLHKSS
ncbi:uncharacterized protein AB675_129 [Cyphellophora attinorum]|uniref:BTB domain-containing protein n=1 Tax=Cyphellophora attinorum TaxID=1664694 RepID=A0A0N0NK58_9EURO|nr:uncharacterized protein AB675_129 [Phialophora attinorum]KPI37761.1 hypothetical protein AB675_129 [Phialophora attinorum]